MYVYALSSDFKGLWSEFTSAAYLAAGDKTDLTINIEQDDWNSAYAGDYEDEVIFTITYEEIPTT